MSARVNLLPREIEERARTRRTAGFTIGAVAAFAAVLLLVYLAKLGDLNQAREERDRAQQTVAELNDEKASLQEFAELDRLVNARNQLLASALASEISWASVLNNLALTFPGNSSLVTLEANLEGVQAAGDGGAAAQQAADPTPGRSVADVSFEGYSVDEYAPGVERVLLKFSDVAMFFNAYLAEAGDEKRGDTVVTRFSGTLQVNNDARTGRYVEGLPPEAGR